MAPTSSGIPLDAGALMSTVLEGILYGFSVLMFMGTIWTLTHERRMQDINRPITVVAILLFMLSTAHMIVNIIRAEDAFVTYRDTFKGGSVGFFADVTQETYVIKHGIYLAQTLLADGVVIYRCYVVWQSIWIIVLPSMLWCSVAVIGIVALYGISQAGTNSGNIFAPVLAQWVTAFFASTIATNLLSSGLLAYRIWMFDRSVSAVRASTKNTMMPIVRVLVDAAVLYCVVLFTALICFVIGNNGQDAVVDMAMPIMSIAFYMVLIRIAINKRTRSYLSTMHGWTTDETEDSDSSRQYPSKHLEVRVSTFTQNDNASGYGKENEDRSSTRAAESKKEVVYSV
ncbi:uncharacterized protein EDB91DRAFT_1156941 [Suillus paluster]|uniref:uncharacterized protein n=1 Tax=Suillus paluster TaxID=48578 RepID=UPI001B87D9F6|nr:uncharacterized protein EDB91DRAFT_1156941 [Suillus paluster]KAG1730543.1 hypothetical protein EDB91DRAFT_1156941 [Suillus paluster]